MTNSIKYIISLYISIWSSYAFNYLDKIPKPKHTLNREYVFVQYQKNELIKPYPNTMQRYYQAMDGLINNKQKKVNIVHIGDSHIQADFFSNRVRSHFNDEKILGNGGRGYIFPCSMAKSDNPYNLRVAYQGIWTGCKNIQVSRSCSWGLGGMTASTIDANAQFTIDPNSKASHKYPITKIKVYYRVNDPSSYGIKLMLPEGAVVPDRLDIDGFAEFQLNQAVSLVTFQLDKKFPEQNNFTLEGISLENDLPGVQYHAVGVNGATVLSFLNTPKLESHLKSLNPDLIIFSLGTNDAYTTNFDSKGWKLQFARLIQRIKNACPDVSIVISTPGDCALPGGRLNASNQNAVRVVFELAEEMNCAVWDLFQIMGGLGSVTKWMGKGLSAPDRVHLTGKGYRLQGDLLYDALIQDYANYCFRK